LSYALVIFSEQLPLNCQYENKYSRTTAKNIRLNQSSSGITPDNKFHVKSTMMPRLSVLGSCNSVSAFYNSSCVRDRVMEFSANTYFFFKYCQFYRVIKKILTRQSNIFLNCTPCISLQLRNLKTAQ
jgi:hypothetical protein